MGVGVKCINVTLSHPIELKTQEQKEHPIMGERENEFLMGQFMGSSLSKCRNSHVKRKLAIFKMRRIEIGGWTRDYV